MEIFSLKIVVKIFLFFSITPWHQVKKTWSDVEIAGEIKRVMAAEDSDKIDDEI